MGHSDLATTNKLLFILVLPVIFFSLQLLNFIFIPLLFAIFIALLFTPFMRWMKRKNVPEVISLIISIIMIVAVIFIAFKTVQLSGQQINAGKEELFQKLDAKVTIYAEPFSNILGVQPEEGQSFLNELFKSEKIEQFLFDNFTNTFGFLQKTLVTILMTLFFLVLLLAGSLNFKDILSITLFRGNTQSVKTFIKIEKSISRFLKMKTLVSLMTGIAYGLIAYALDISFPLFWGLFAFVINYVQMVGSIIAAVFAFLFAFIELESPGSIALAAILFSGAQIVFGGVVEPILMGKSFKINIIVVLVMLMFWGFLWGVPGMILAIPLTVLLKIILSEFSRTKKIADLMA